MAIDLRSVTIEYCKNNRLWRKTIDLEKAGGLWWNDGSGKAGGNRVPPGTQQQLGPCPPAGMVVVAKPTACWWDNGKNEWVCPDDLG